MLRCSGELIQSFLRNPDQSRRPSLGALAGGQEEWPQRTGPWP